MASEILIAIIFFIYGSCVLIWEVIKLKCPHKPLNSRRQKIFTVFAV